MPAEAAKPEPSTFEQRASYEQELLVGVRMLGLRAMGALRSRCCRCVSHSLTMYRFERGCCGTLPSAAAQKPASIPHIQLACPTLVREQEALRARGKELPELKAAPEGAVVEKAAVAPLKLRRALPRAAAGAGVQ